MIRTVEDKKNNVIYLHSHNLGFAIKSRVGEAVQKGLLVQDKAMKDYGFTYKTLDYTNFWKWLQGDNDTLVPKRTILD